MWLNSPEADWLGVIHQAVRLSLVKNADFLHNLTTALYSVNSTTMGHSWLSFYPFFSNLHLYILLHIWNDGVSEMPNSVAHFSSFCNGSKMTACEWQTRWNPEGAFGEHVSLLRETGVQGGTITVQWCGFGAVDLSNATDVRPSSVYSMFSQCYFKRVLFHFASDCPSSLHQTSKKYVPNKCEQDKANHCPCHAEWTCSCWGRGHWSDLQ